MNSELHQVYSHRSDLSFMQGLMQAAHMYRLTESGKGYSIAAAWGCCKRWGCDEHKACNSQADWKHLKPVLLSPESLVNPCPRPRTILFKQKTLTHFRVPEAGSIERCCCHCLFFFCVILRQSFHWILPTASEVTALVSFIIFSKLKQISARR